MTTTTAMANTTTTAAAACPRRLFIHQLRHGKSTCAVLIRLMGTVISTTERTKENLVMLSLDDGTGTIRIALEPCHHPTENVIGRTVDITCRKQKEEEEGALEESLWMADTIVWNVRDVHAESLRGLEIRAQIQATTNSMSNEEFKWGYPCRLPNKSDVFRLIRTSGVEGASLEDLAIVLGLEGDQIQPMLQELQVRGEIYKNRQGAFVPL